MNSIDIIGLLYRLFYGLLDLGLMVVWSMALFHIGTLFQKNKEVLAYFNITGTDAVDHLIDNHSPSGFNPSAILSTVGKLLKIYAIASIVVEFLSMFKFLF